MVSSFITVSVHDESTFRSGEVSAKRWLFQNQEAFYSKGRGRSNMVSDFLVMHPSGPFFQLSPEEYRNALKKYPELNDEDDINYLERSASASIHVSSETYFDNSTILSQFERLFKLLQFKRCFQNHNIEIIVDNARTHSARAYSILDFGKGISTRCPVDHLRWLDDEGIEQSLSCFFQSGSNKGKSKGLLEIAKELLFTPSLGITLKELHHLLNQHPAFRTVAFPLYLQKIRD